VTPRDYAEAERRISRGPCGGWHWNGWDRRDPHRWHACAACVRLGNLTGESLTANLSSTISEQITANRSYAGSKLSQGEISGAINYECQSSEFLYDMLICALQADATLTVSGSGGSWDADEAIQNGSSKQCLTFLKRVGVAGDDDAPAQPGVVAPSQQLVGQVQHGVAVVVVRGVEAHHAAPAAGVVDFEVTELGHGYPLILCVVIAVMPLGSSRTGARNWLSLPSVARM
jgi:hypothetical protein